MRVVVFTTVLGQTDTLRPPAVVNPHVAYRCFTDDRALAVEGWDIIQVGRTNDPIIASRRLKICAHETVGDADVSLWMDAAFELMTDPVALAHRWLWHADVMALEHPHRTNIEDEGREIVRLGLAQAEAVNKQLEAYAERGFSKVTQLRLTSTGLCLRRHAPRVTRFNAAWWNAFEEAGHGRDQMSVDFAAIRAGVDIAYLTGHYRDNPYARWYKDAKRPRTHADHTHV